MKLLSKHLPKKFLVLFLLIAVSCEIANEKDAVNSEKEEKEIEVKGVELKGDFFDQAFQLPEIPYKSDALEPYIDQTTMEIHHQRHHRAYVNNLNNALINSVYNEENLPELMNEISGHSPAVRNNGGGHYNHKLFWSVMSPDGGGQPSGALAQAINDDLGSFNSFKEQFSNAALTQFGSGWAWLSVDKNGKLFISNTPNQDNPLMDVVINRGTPILALDVWEHAYYLGYQNQRAEYVKAFWNVINWNEVERRYLEAIETLEM